MTVDIQVTDDALAGFNQQAQNRLKEALESYSSDLVSEANRIEAGRRSSEGPPEITSTMVEEAEILVLRGLAQPKRRIGSVILRVVAAALALGTGVMVDKEALQESGGYLFLFILAITATILTTTISIVRDK